MDENTNTLSIVQASSVSPAPSVLTPRRGMSLVKRSLFTLTVEELQRLDWLAKALATSQLSYAKNGKNALSEGDLKIIMLKGMEIGLEPMMALESIDLISGKPTLDPAGMLALAQASGELEDIRILEESDAASEIEMKRRAQSPYRRRWTIEDAAKMLTTEWRNGQSSTIPLTEKANWRQQPSIMLKWRNVSAICRIIFGDIIQGMYTPEELGAEVSVDDSGVMTVVTRPEVQTPTLPAGTPDHAGEAKKPAKHWTEDAETLTNVYNRLIAKEYAKDIEDAKTLLERAKIDLKTYAAVKDLTDLIPRIDAYLAGNAAHDEDQPANAPESAAEADAMLADAEADDDPLANVPPMDRDASWEHKAAERAEKLTGMKSADILAKLGKPSWMTYGTLTRADEALIQAIADLQLPFVCKALTYSKLGRGGWQVVFHAPGKAVNVPLPGGRGEIAKLMGGDTAPLYTRFAIANDLASWEKKTSGITLAAPVLVTWRMNGSNPQVTALAPIFPDAEQQAA